MKKIVKFIVLLMIIPVLIFSFKSSAKSDYITSLLNNINQNDENDVNSSIKKIYSDKIVPRIISNREDLLTSEVSDNEIKEAKISPAMPVFVSPEEYKKGEDFDSKLQFSEWMFISYVDNNPIAIFIVSKEKDSEYRVNNLINESFAKSFAEALMKLNDRVVVLPASGYYFIGDTNDNVSLVKVIGDESMEYDIKTFEEFNAAMNKTIDYYNNQSEDEDEIGGSIVLEYLYGDKTPNISLNTRYVIVSLIIVLLILGVIFLTKVRAKLKNN